MMNEDPIENLSFDQAIDLLKEIREKVARPLLSRKYINATAVDATVYDAQDTLSIGFGIDWAWDDATGST